MSAATAENTPPSIMSGAGIPLSRLVTVELRRMFDTRAGFWLMASVAIVSAIATIAVILFADDSILTYGTFAAAIGFPLGMILPVIAILSVTSEWSQRTGLVTFTMEPRRSRIVWSKGIACVIVAVVAMAVALVIGAVGNLLGAALTGVDLTWDLSFDDIWKLVLGNVIGLLQGFAFGVLIRNSPGAIVAYFAYSFALPTLTGVLAAFQDWFADIQKWIDFSTAQAPLFSGSSVSGEEWAQMLTSGSVWLLLPLVVGIFTLLRAEVK
ncbi:MAG: ABC transporter permease [Nocardioidaceae bacterium]